MYKYSKIELSAQFEVHVATHKNISLNNGSTWYCEKEVSMFKHTIVTAMPL